MAGTWLLDARFALPDSGDAQCDLRATSIGDAAAAYAANDRPVRS